MTYRLLAGSLLLLASVPVACQGQGQAAANPRIDPSWLKWNAATKTVTFHLIAGAPGAQTPFNFNGYGNGNLTLVIPAGATVNMPFVNEDGVPHSAEVISGTGPIPNSGGDPAIPRAYTISLLEGLPQGGKDNINFTATPAATYRIFCGVPGHGLSGMYIDMRIDATATEPRLETTPAKKN